MECIECGDCASESATIHLSKSLDQYLAQTNANYVAGVNRALGNTQISVTEIAAGRYRYLSDDNRYYIDFK